MNREPVAADQQESYSWLTCKRLTANEDWKPQHDTTADYTRAVTWTDDDSSKRALHKLTELGVKKILRPPQPWMFHLTRLEAEAQLGRFSQYFIVRGGLYNVMHSPIVLPRRGEDINEHADRTNRGIKASQDFLVDNGLLAPNSEDKFELLDILNRGLVVTDAA